MKFHFSDNNNTKSLSHSFRMSRFLFFKKLLSRVQKPCTILDIGGTVEYWKMMQFEDPQVSITLLNLAKIENLTGQFTSVSGDATHLTAFSDSSIDVVYSNSVIEHLYSFESQRKMADEVRRVGRNYFIQTPNYYFFMEPHWVFPFFQFLPVSLRIWMTRNFSLGHIGKIKDTEEASDKVHEIRLLTKKEMQRLFPEALIYEEKFLFFTKSIVAYYFPSKA